MKRFGPFWGLERHKGHVVDMHNSWANINDKGAWNKPHKHNGCWMSGAFLHRCTR